jgi:hypothetical protein
MIPTAITTDHNIPSNSADDGLPCVFLDASLNNADASDWWLDQGQVHLGE